VKQKKKSSFSEEKEAKRLLPSFPEAAMPEASLLRIRVF
jgi:hypothetical protein